MTENYRNHVLEFATVRPMRGAGQEWVDGAVAQSPILGTTITLERLVRRGYESMLSYYEQVSPQINEPLHTRPVCTVV